MQKKIIALAVAGLVSGAAFAQSNVTIYGTMRASLTYVDNKAADTDRWQLDDQSSRIGFKGEEALGGGLKAIWQWESALNATMNAAPTAGATVGTTQRNTFVGLSGGFGTFLMGTHDTPYKLGGSADLFGDTVADSQKNTTGIIARNGFDNRAASTMAYISPTWSGFHFAAAVIPGEEGAGTAATNDANGLADAYSLVAVYANGPLKLTLGHESFSKEITGNTAAQNATKLNVAYKVGAIGLGYTYERSKDAALETDNAHLASVSYTMGNNVLGLQYGRFNDQQTSASDVTRLSLGMYHNLSKRTQAYAAYSRDTRGDGGEALEGSGITFGLNHSF
ncbi:MAG: porin [Sulfuritalea sp.]|jgi:predicted porin|nr:porin [Sulfuritalea sp.]